MEFGPGIGTRISRAKTENGVQKLLAELATYEYASDKTRGRLKRQAAKRIAELKEKK